MAFLRWLVVIHRIKLERQVEMVEIDDEVLTDRELEGFSERPSFVGAPRCEDLTKLDADIAVLGIPYKTLDNPLDKRIGAINPQLQTQADPSQSTSELLAADAIRQQSLRFAGYLDHYDFDFGGDILAGRAVKIVDCGNIVTSPHKSGNFPSSVFSSR